MTLYERHKEAFEFIFDCRPEPNSLLSVVRSCVQGVQGLIVDSSASNILRFTVEFWDDHLKVIKGDPTKWSKTGRGLLFEVKTYTNAPGRVNLLLMLGPVEQEVRTKVYEFAASQPELFKGLVRPMGVQWATIFSRDLLTVSQAKGMTFEAQAFNVGLAWSDFQGSQLNELINAISGIDGHLAQTADFVATAAPLGPRGAA